MNADLDSREAKRLLTLHELGVLDTPPEERFDRITRLAARLLRAPISMITLVDRERLWIKSRHGTDVREIPRGEAFCNWAIMRDEPFEVPDATHDRRFCDLEAVAGEEHYRYYYGMPLRAPNGCRMGALCILDLVPRRLSDEERSIMAVLAAAAAHELNLHLSEDTMASRDQAQSVLHATQKRFRSFLDQSPIVAFVRRPDHSVVFANYMARDLFELPAEGPATAEQLRHLGPDEERTDAEVLREGHSLQYTIRHTDPGGRERLWLMIKFLVPGDHGERWLGTIGQDVTQGLKAQQELAERSRQLEKANAELREADRYKDEFLAVVSHELRTPLNFISGFASLLQDEVSGPLNPEQREQVKRILEGSDRLQILINNLLEMSRIIAGRFQLNVAPISFAELLEGAVAPYRSQAETRGLTLAFDVQDPGVVEVDAVHLTEVLQQLIDNALKYTPAGGTVTIAARRLDGELLGEVRDTGVGLAPAEQVKLFTRFGQLDMTSTRRSGGTGLGLALSKAIIEAHGGRIGVESTPAVGSTFWFRLPQPR